MMLDAIDRAVLVMALEALRALNRAEDGELLPCSTRIVEDMLDAQGIRWRRLRHPLHDYLPTNEQIDRLADLLK